MEEFTDLFADVAVEEHDLQSLSLFDDWSLLFDPDEANNIWYALETTVQDLESCTNEQQKEPELLPPMPTISDVSTPAEQSTVYNKVPEYFQESTSDNDKLCEQTNEQTCKQISQRNDELVLNFTVPGDSANICSQEEECKVSENSLYTKIPSYIMGLTCHGKPPVTMKYVPPKAAIIEPSNNKLIAKPADCSSDLNSKARTSNSGKRGRSTGSFPQRKCLRPDFRNPDFDVAKCAPSSTKPFRSKSGTYEKLKPLEDRRIVYVGNVTEDTTTSGLRQRFAQFGAIIDVSLHFREHGDNYGFITFSNTADAIRAIEHGNDNPQLPKYELCFGGRRQFCKSQYADLDSFESPSERRSKETDFDTLLKTAKLTIER